MSRRWALSLVVLASFAAAAAENPATLLQRLRSGPPAERRAAAERLAEVGGDSATAELARSLRDPDDGVRDAAQAALWAIWHRSGRPEIDALLRAGIAAMSERRYPEAVAIFSEVIGKAPAFAEGWNKRATVYYLMGEYDRSIEDCEEVVRQNPIHFGALSGFGLNYLEKDNLERAAEYFERALRVNPNLDQIQAMLEQIREVLRQRRRNTL